MRSDVCARLCVSACGCVRVHKETIAMDCAMHSAAVRRLKLFLFLFIFTIFFASGIGCWLHTHTHKDGLYVLYNFKSVPLN